MKQDGDVEEDDDDDDDDGEAGVAAELGVDAPEVDDDVDANAKSTNLFTVATKSFVRSALCHSSASYTSAAF